MRIAVYCGSCPGFESVHRDTAADLSLTLVQAGHGIVFGGGKVGLMGTVADAAMQAGGEVIGVIPQSLLDKELGHAGVTTLHVVHSMHERKQLMVDLSDAFVALPGGFGTLDELFETLTWLQLGFHSKPVGLLNVDGFFNGMLAFLDHMVAQGFLRQEHRNCLLVADNAKELLAQMQAFTPPDLGKWMEKLAADER